MKRKISLFLVLGFILSIVLAVQAWTTLSVHAQVQPSTLEAPLSRDRPRTLPDIPVEPQTDLPADISVEAAAKLIPAVQFCQTCGGKWPFRAGDFYFNATPSYIYKRGVKCGGSLVITEDPNTQVCARGVK